MQKIITERKCAVVARLQQPEIKDKTEEDVNYHEEISYVFGLCDNYQVTHKNSYSFTLGMHPVIEGIDRAITGMCIGEKLCVTIPGKLGFGDGGRKRDGIKSDHVLRYIVQLVDQFRPTPGPRWREEDGLEIELFVFLLHHGEVIAGMDRVMISMCEGERRRVMIPAALGYGHKGRDNVPGGATLYFDMSSTN
ncbi:hypothetical protein niasHS_009036 [Heterodera schachtii]|uniref:peptidylprolyl isomerase n=1 Tax=Heterodera schachtii TaxID=97005 RepID=A0ABD2J1N9_HETSC